MEFNKFESIISTIRKTDKAFNTLEEVGFSTIDSAICQGYWDLQKEVFVAYYGEDGAEFINWALYDVPNMIEEKEDYGDTPHMWDERNNPVVLKTLNDLWEYAEKEYGAPKDSVCKGFEPLENDVIDCSCPTETDIEDSVADYCDLNNYNVGTITLTDYNINHGNRTLTYTLAGGLNGCGHEDEYLRFMMGLNEVLFDSDIADNLEKYEYDALDDVFYLTYAFSW
jgi:hypothetical protein